MRAQLRAGAVPAAMIATTLAALAFAIFLPQIADAQKKNKEDANARGVQGVVLSTDDKPVAGAVVQLKDMRSLQVRSFIAQGDGAYHFTGLKTDIDYQLKASSAGSESGWKTLSVFDDRKNAVINLKLDKK